MKKIIGIIALAGLLGWVAFSPIDLLRAQTTPHGVTLTWSDAGSGASAPTSYNVLRGTSAGSETQLATVQAPTTTYFDGTGTQGNTYFYEVAAVNAAGTSAPSNEVSATFLVIPQIPPSPSGLKGAVN